MTRPSPRSRALAERDARPVCPTCCGTLYVNHPAFPNGGAPCPDCVDGRVPLERLANLFTAVHDPMYHTCCLKDVPATWAGAFSHLRAIR